ncbi:MAG TPA: glycine--tRNA ligase subunit beta [Nitrospirales bacterium]|jgi:glycyl-tRNA synthetase beta chain
MRERTKTPVAQQGSELLLEIGTEELPAQFVTPACEELRAQATRLLAVSRLRHGPIITLGTPRRLALVVEGVSQAQEPIATEVMGPSRAVGFDPDGKPTRAALGFAAGQGVQVDALEIRPTPKGEYLFAIKRDPGRKTGVLLPDLLAQLLEGLSFPKAMRWNNTGARFARPVRWILALYGSKVVRVEFAGVKAGNTTLGHRFISSGRPLTIRDFKSYLKVLEKAGVMVDQAHRRAIIVSQLAKLAQQKGGILLEDHDLVEQAVFTVEMPFAIAGSFNSGYLTLPKEVLITAMKEHQGYFSLLTPDGGLLPHFIAVINMGAKQAATIRAGNERVLAARLADAKFFYDEDRKVTLESRVEQLKGVTFHQKLGTLHHKVERLVTLAPQLAYTLGVSDQAESCARAAKLCKADLLTGMVGEFPTLQGIMGREYALHDGEPQAVANAIADHYLPRFADDRLPGSPAGTILSLADRLDTLAGFFAIGLIPSGSQDPFALRRHASAIIRLLLEGGRLLNLSEAIREAFRGLKEHGIQGDEKGIVELERFLAERLRYYIREVVKLREDVMDAVLAGRATDTFDPCALRARATALHSFTTRPEFESLVIGCKRAENITKSVRDEEVDMGLLKEPVERELQAALMTADSKVAPLLQAGKFAEALDALATLKGPIDAFFTGVMVMTDEAPLRRNRLALLVRVRNLFRQYADFSKIQVEAR